MQCQDPPDLRQPAQAFGDGQGLGKIAFEHFAVEGSLDFGALTFHPPEEGLLEVPVGSDELVLLVSPSHELATQKT